MKDKDCYMFVDPAIPEEERCMSFLCEDCKERHYPDTDMHFYAGSEEGYGPYDFECDKCGIILHKEEEGEE